MFLLWGFSEHELFFSMLLLLFFCQNLSFCSCLNHEGIELVALSSLKDDVGEKNHCSWSGVECSGGNVLLLKAKTAHRKLLGARARAQNGSAEKPRWIFVPRMPIRPWREKGSSPLPSPSPSPSPSPPEGKHTPIPHHPKRISSLNPPPPVLSPAESPITSASPSRDNHDEALFLSASIGGPLFLLLLVFIILFLQRKRVAAVKPWATGLSGQLQRAFVTGVPKLKRSEIQAACEDFSNVIGYLSVGTLYKGTLSSGVEIAVLSLEAASSKDWSKNLKTQFRKKIDALSKMNHKNFVNLLGYCEESKPLTRMIVFEYAPNGTLFEHLHIKEAEHLNWEMRMRIAMGIAYCLERMHELVPPIPHRNLNSSAVYLTEDYAAKVSDFSFTNQAAADKMEPNSQTNVYSFGVILFEMITGRLPYSVDNGTLEDWASDYLNEAQNLTEAVDPTLESFQVEQLTSLSKVMRSCVNPDPAQRPSMREVTARLREITTIGPDGAIPRLSPLWWAELEILSGDIN